MVPGVKNSDKPKNVQAWQDRIYAREAVKKGLVSFSLSLNLLDLYIHADVPHQDVPSHNDLLDKLLDPDFETKYAEEADNHAKQSAAWVQKGMKEDKK